MTGQEHVDEVRETLRKAREHHPESSPERAVILLSAQQYVLDFVKTMGPADIYTAKRMVAELG